MNAAIAFFGGMFYGGMLGMLINGTLSSAMWTAGMGVGLITSAILASKKCDKGG